MLSPDEIKQRIDTEDMIRFMEYFGADIGQMNEEYITFTSICHGSESHKFYFYPQTKSTHCFVCSNVDIFTIIQQELDLTFNESLEWAEEFFGLGKQRGFGRKEKPIFKPREIQKKEIDVSEQLPVYNESILNTFYNISPLEWIKEGISNEVMEKFGIKFDINTGSIIIPHRDIDGRLVGVRCRNLQEDIIERYGKYIPYTCPLSGIIYKHKLSMNLYGLYENKENILNRKRCIIFESEKSTMLMNSYYPNDSIAISVGGSVVSDYQIALLKHLGIKEVIIAFDYEIREKLLKKFEKSYKKCALQFDVYILDSLLMKEWLEESDSPIDKGREKFEKLLWNKRKYELEVK